MSSKEQTIVHVQSLAFGHIMALVSIKSVVDHPTHDNHSKPTSKEHTHRFFSRDFGEEKRFSSKPCSTATSKSGANIAVFSSSNEGLLGENPAVIRSDSKRQDVSWSIKAKRGIAWTRIAVHEAALTRTLSRTCRAASTRTKRISGYISIHPEQGSSVSNDLLVLAKIDSH